VVSWFSDCKETMKDESCSDQNITIKTEKFDSAVEDYMMLDRRITVRHIAENFDIIYSTAQDILSNRWVPNFLTPEQTGVRVIINPKIFKRRKFVTS